MELVIGTQTEKCILCHCDTHVPVNQPVETRFYYIEGAGQTCNNCYDDARKFENEIKGWGT